MNSLFEGATSFNQDLKSWCVINFGDSAGEPIPSNVSSKNSGLSENNYPLWGTCGLSDNFYLANNGITIK